MCTCLAKEQGQHLVEGRETALGAPIDMVESQKTYDISQLPSGNQTWQWKMDHLFR